MLLAAFTGVVIVLAGCAATQGTPATKKESTVIVPDVVGQVGSDARDALTKAGLTVEWDAGDQTVIMASHWNVEGQDPAARGSAKDGSVVTLTVTKPEKTVATNNIADRTKTALLNAYGVKEFSDLLPNSPDSLVPLITGFESPTTGTVVIAVQVTKSDTDKDELKSTARAIHSLVGLQVKDLDRVEVVTADQLLRGVSNRRNVPLLNQ